MFLDDDKICAVLLDYVANDKTNQAVLIEGEWGSGKTYFIRNVFASKYCTLNKNNRLYYISLYGITSIEQIENILYEQMLEKYTADKLSTVAVKPVKFLQKSLPIFLQKLGIDDKDTLKCLIEEIKPITDMVIIFDDLERCNMALNEILGYINNLVEHNNVKAVVLANEKEIWRAGFTKDIAAKYNTAIAHMQMTGNTSTEDVTGKDEVKSIQLHAEKIFSQDNGYEKVKEKLIGRTIKYCKPLRLSYDSVLANIVDDEDTLKILKSCSNVILPQFETSKHSNIRTLVSVFSSFQKINKLVQGITTEHVAFVEDIKVSILNYLTYCTLKVKTGESLEPWNDRENFSKHISVKEDSGNKLIYGYRFVHDLVTYGYVDEEGFIEEFRDFVLKTGEITNYNYFIENESAWGFLSNWRLLEDEELEKYLQQLKSELDNNKYKIANFGQIIKVLVDISQNGFNIVFDNYLNPMKDMIEGENADYISIAGFYAYGNNTVANDRYRELIRPIIELIEKKNTKGNILKHEFLNTGNWDMKYVMMCQENHSYFINVNKFFAYFNLAIFSDKLNRAKAKDVLYFLNAIKQVYNFKNLNDCFKVDIENLEKMLGIVNDVLKITEKKTLRLNLAELSKVMAGCLEKLRK